MKTIAYENDVIVNCPICKKKIFDGTKDEGVKACKHLQAWHNNVLGEFVFAQKRFESNCEAYLGNNEENDESDFIQTLKNDKGTIVHVYKGDYIGGCMYPVDTVVFSKQSKKKLTDKTISAIRKSFYQTCVKEGLSEHETTAIISDMTSDSTKDVMAGIKASRQRKLNARAKKAWATRKANN